MTTLKLKLLIEKNSSKVVFAEARKEFVDFLFGHLQVPLGSIMGLLSQYDMVDSAGGSLSRVYESIKNLDPSFLEPNVNKESDFLRPKPTFSSNTDTPELLLNFVPPNTPIPIPTAVIVPATSKTVTVGSTSDITQQKPHTEKKETGYVRGVVTYMVMDDLMVKPMSSISGISLLNDLSIKDISSLQEKMVEVDLKKGLELVRASFYSTTVLTDVFIGNKRGRSFQDIWDSFDGFFTSNLVFETTALANLRIDWKISGERSKEQLEKNDKWYRIERSGGKFLRRFQLPYDAIIGQIKASMEDGVLTVIVPIEEEKMKRDLKAIQISRPLMSLG
uniref:SHSP domain-containing protein n=1 Tax=Fagus sylvatica TaxID=28930 RepID=A0A2N9EFU7_FAGSY